MAGNDAPGAAGDGDRQPDARTAFDHLVASMDSALLVVTASSGSHQAGCLVGFHSQCSIEPPRYALWLSTANRTHRVAAQASHLGVHLLGRDQHEVARLFGAETGDEVDKFRPGTWTSGTHGVPLLTACPNRMVVKRLASFDAAGGDHALYVTEPVETASAHDQDPLRLAAVRDLTAGHPPGEGS